MMKFVFRKIGALQSALFAAFLVLGLCSANAQTPAMLLLSSDSIYKESDGLFLIGGNAMIGSNSLDNLFLRKSIFGGHLESQHIANLRKGMSDQNRAGFMANAGFEVFNFKDTLFKRPHWGLKVSVNTNHHASMSFSKDLFSIIYQGNKSYAGDTAFLGPLFMQYQAWQKISLGVFNKHTLSSVSLSLVEGQSYHSLMLNDASLYTSANGDSLSLSYQGDYWRSDSTKVGLMNGSGLGAAIDVEYNIPLEDNEGVISLAIYDAGFVAWNRMSQHFEFDSLTTGQGADVNDLSGLTNDSLGLTNLRDTLAYGVTSKAMIAPLPMSIHLRYCRFFGKRNYYEAGLSMWPNKASVPLAYAGVTHFLHQDFSISERLSYGGYGRFGIGAEINWMPCGQWLVRVGTRNIGGFTSGSMHGRDIYFSLAKTF